MKLSENFTLEELTATNKKLPNNPGTNQIIALQLLVDNILQPVREMFGDSIKVNSGYRSEAVNKAVRGSTTSSHLRGEAADLDCSDNARLFNLIKDNFVFDQLIWEAGNDNQPAWVHVSYRHENNRKQVLKMKDGNYTIL